MTIPRIHKVEPLKDYELYVEFDDRHKVVYDMKDGIRELAAFKALMDVYGLFRQVTEAP
jgi:hypothetical protein